MAFVPETINEGMTGRRVRGILNDQFVDIATELGRLSVQGEKAEDAYNEVFGLSREVEKTHVESAGYLRVVDGTIVESAAYRLWTFALGNFSGRITGSTTGRNNYCKLFKVVDGQGNVLAIASASTYTEYTFDVTVTGAATLYMSTIGTATMEARFYALSGDGLLNRVGDLEDAVEDIEEALPALEALPSALVALTGRVSSIEEDLFGFTKDLTQSSGNLSRGVALDFSGKCKVKLSVKSGTDSGDSWRWKVYRYVNGAIGTALSDNVATFGTEIEVDIPSGDDGIWVYTHDATIGTARTYRLEITEIEGTTGGRLKTLEDETEDLRLAMEDMADDVGTLKSEVVPTVNATFVDECYINMNVSVGGTLADPVANADGMLATVPVDSSLVDIVFRTWAPSKYVKSYAIVDENDTVLALGSYSSTTIQSGTITAASMPAGAAKVYFNFWKDQNKLSSPTVQVTRKAIEALKNYVDANLANVHTVLEGKRLLCFGDSLTEGVGNRISNKYVSWADYLQREFGAVVTKLGVGGSRLCPLTLEAEASQNGYYVYNLVKAWHDDDWTLVDATTEWCHGAGDYGTRWDHVPATLKNSAATDYDIVTIAAGTNDWHTSGGMTLGTFADTNPVRNISASLKGIIQMLLEMNPNLYILVLPPQVRYAGNDFSGEGALDPTKFSDSYADNISGLYLYDISDTELSVAKKMHVQALDMYYRMGFNIVNWKTYSADGTHLKAVGYQAMAQFVGHNIIANYNR